MRGFSSIQRSLLRFLGLLVLVSITSKVYETTFPLGTTVLPPEWETKSRVDTVKKVIDTQLGPETLHGLLDRKDGIQTDDIGGQLFDSEPSVDPWGTPLVIIKRDSATGREPATFGVFSKGPDAVTFSNGNDADDISTWATLDNPYWNAVRQRAFIRRWTKQCAWAGALTLVVSILLNRYNRSREGNRLGRMS